MLELVHWLAAMEKVHGIPVGIYQAEYSNVLHEAQFDSLMENLLAAAIIDFANEHMKDGEWTGTATELLNKLNFMAPDGTMRSYEWPKNPIALSKRLNSLKASLLTQGINVEFSRGKQRKITIKNFGDNNN